MINISLAPLYFEGKELENIKGKRKGGRREVESAGREGKEGRSPDGI